MWSKYMLAKYCKMRHPLQARVHHAHSRVWKNLVAVRDQAEQHISWQIGSGTCDFWQDSWLHSGPLDRQATESISITSFWQNGRWDVDKLRLWVTQEQVLNEWSLPAPYKGHARQLVPVVIIWALWEARNKAKHGTRRYTLANIQARVGNLVYYIGRTDILHLKHWKGDLNVAAEWNVQIFQPIAKPPRLLSWHRPPNGIDKLNVDGAYKNGVGGLGGVLRNSQGHRLAAVDAEIQAVLQVLKWEQNMAADHVAKEVMKRGARLIWEPGQESVQLKAIVALEGPGLPYIR
ncbi:hypothetical protein LIER_25959 [Lithospermum erythrorhizon]|uniref:RNase H type-1 domain-containing protein n=1 Tax=Lithospermum erythrorhizon TaxID=34254 RepID=A0AAV3R7Z9_LITER